MNKVDKKRLKRIKQEFSDGFKLFTRYDKGVVIFGSARTLPENKYYKQAYDLSFRLAKLGYPVLSGGGMGTMKAANKGAFDAKGKSIGLNIKLPHEQFNNKYTTKSMTFNYFFIRKFFLTYLSRATVVFPGGWGTMDEAYEHLTLLQTKKIKQRPIIFVGKDYYKDVFNWWKDVLVVKNKTIGEKDIKQYAHLVNSNEEAIEILNKAGVRNVKK